MQLKDWLSNMRLIIMDTNQQSLYCVISKRVIGDLVKYPEHKVFLIKSDKPVELEKLRRAVREYVATQNQVSINLVSIYETKLIKSEDRDRWYEIVESRQWCYEYRNDKIYQVFL